MKHFQVSNSFPDSLCRSFHLKHSVYLYINRTVFTATRRFFLSIFFTIFSDAIICDCQTVNVISNKGGVQGTYEKSGYVNGRTSWNSSIGTAVWFDPYMEDWIFGAIEGLGGTAVLLGTPQTGNDTCFYNVSDDQWQYYDYGANSWAYVNDGDVSIQCLSGNFK